MSTVLVADVLFDGAGPEPLERPAVTVAGERLASVEQRGPAWRPPPDATVLDLTGCTLTPGLIDAHVHLAFDAGDGAHTIAFMQEGSEDEIVATMRQNAAAALRGGLTTVRDCGSPGTTAVRLRAERSQGALASPRLLVSGRPITTRTGHCHWIGLVAESEPQVRDAVRTLVAEDVDFVKVMATGGMMTPGSDPYTAQYTAEELAALVEEAHAAGRRVAAHVLSAEGLRRAVLAGVDTVEHCWTITGARQDHDETTWQRMAEREIIGSVTGHHTLRSMVDADDVDGLRARLAAHRRLRDAGVTLLVHSDAGTPGTLVGEFAKSVEAFMLGLDTTAAEAIQAATAAPALALGLAGEVGTVEAGKRADLLAVEGDVRADIRALRRVACVVQDGRIVVRDGALVE
jgi:imidazolonepropionase-like amidohydrolase